MAAKKRALGRGLDALLGIGAEQLVQEERNGDQLKIVPVDLIKRGRYQPRTDIKAETLQELADSIKVQGIIQPVLVRPLKTGSSFELVAGERRWRAAQMAGLQEIPAIVRVIEDRAVMSIALIENIQREDLNPLEEAAALHRLIDEFDMTHQAVAEAVGRSRAAVSNLLRLLDLDTEVKKYLESGELEMGHGRAIAALASGEQARIARRVIANDLSVRQTERLVRKHKVAADDKPLSRKPQDPDVRRLETSLGERLGAKVSIRHRASGKGSLSIQYNSLDELEGILEHIN
jgi:ParB family chromosome partitioning protein